MTQPVELESIRQEVALLRTIVQGLLENIEVQRMSDHKEAEAHIVESHVISDSDFPAPLRIDGRVGVDTASDTLWFRSSGSWHQLLTPLSTLTVTDVTNTYVVLLTDAVIFCDASGGAFSVSLPTAAGNDGKRYYIKKTDSSANAVTIDADGSETIDDSLAAIIDRQYDSLTLVSDGTEWWIV